MPAANTRRPALLIAILPLAVLVVLIVFNVLVFGEDTLAGASQLSLLLSALFAAALASRYGKSWKDMMDGVTGTVSASIGAVLILLSIGMLAGAWMISGVIPSFIYYGLSILRPGFFLPAALLICAGISVFTGSSWTTIATIGVAVLGIGDAMGISDAVTAGAIISGAYFGDKISPLSDTTNLASASVGIDLGRHIKYMMKTTVPTFILTLVIFSAISVFGASGAADLGEIEGIRCMIRENFNVTPWLFLVPAAVGVMIARRFPVLPTLICAGLLGAVFALIFQGELLDKLAGEGPGRIGILMRSLYGPVEYKLGDSSLSTLLSTGGMAGMLNTVWLILTAMTFGGVMDSAGFIGRITEAIISRIHSTVSIVTATVLSCILFNIVIADQYLTIVLSGKMFSSSYRDRRLAPEVLSRTIEDAGTVTSVLIPWNSCGATQASVLGVATMAYLPFAFFCYLSPLMSIFFALTGIGIRYNHDTSNNSSKARQ